MHQFAFGSHLLLTESSKLLLRNRDGPKIEPEKQALLQNKDFNQKIRENLDRKGLDFITQLQSEAIESLNQRARSLDAHYTEKVNAVKENEDESNKSNSEDESSESSSEKE